MFEMFLPVSGVLPGERNIMNGQEVFGVLLLGGLGEIEAPRKDRVAVDDHYLVVGDGVAGVDPNGNASVSQEGRGRIMSGAIAAVEYHFYVYPAPVSVHQRFGDGCGGKAIGLDQDAFSRTGQCIYDLLGAARSHAVFRSEANRDFGGKNVRGAREQQTQEEVND